MHLAFSNLALPAFDHFSYLPDLRSLGVEGIEVAPDHTWRRPYFGQGYSINQVNEYRRRVHQAGLRVIGLHALLGGRPELGMFEDAAIRHYTIEHLVHLSSVCRDLGGKTLIVDSRWAGDLPRKEAWLQCRALLERLLPRIEDHGTILCFAPLAPDEGDFCRLARECVMLVNAIDHPSLGLHLGTAALAANGETGHVHFAAVRGQLAHFHIDEPGRAPLGASGVIDHADMRRHLSAITYDGWVSVVQRVQAGASPVEALTAAVGGFNAIYLKNYSRRRNFHV